MEILLTIKDETKVAHILALLKKYSYVKAKPVSAYKAKVLHGIEKSVKELNLIKAGKLKGIKAQDLLNEL